MPDASGDDRSTVRVHRSMENNDEYIKIYNKGARAQVWVAR